MKKKPKVLVLSANAYFEFINAFERAASLKYLDEGYEIWFSYCNKAIRSCCSNPLGKVTRCTKCMLLRQIFQFQNRDFYFVKLPRLLDETKKRLETTIEKITINSEEDLRKLKFDGFDVGLAIASYLLSHSDSDDIRIDVIFDKKQLTRAIIELMICFYSSIRLINEIQPEKIILTNGRCMEQRAFLRAAQQSKIPFISVEGAFKKDLLGNYKNWRYGYIENGSIHDLAKWEDEIESFWDAGSSDKKLIAKDWFEKSGCPETGTKINEFVSGKIKGSVSGLIFSGKPIVSIYSSTWAERGALSDEWDSPFGYKQVDILIRFFETVKDLHGNYDFVLRFHPNQRTVLKEVRKILNILPSIVQYVLPDDPVDSYELLRKSHVVVTVGSTIGAEAAYWNKPSLSLAPAIYRRLGIAFFPRTEAQILDFIQQPFCENQENVYKFGYFMSE